MNDHVMELSIDVPRERILEAVATLDGVRGWWTPIAVQTGGRLFLGFEGMDEAIVLRVDEVAADRVRWTCLEHSGDPAWLGSTVTFAVRDGGLTLTHAGVPRDRVAGGWEYFATRLAAWAEHRDGSALDIARAYHAAWTGGDFARATSLLAPGLRTEVPINTYAGREDFAAALAGFGSLVRRADVLAEFEHGDEALLLYDMETEPFGTIRVAEHFTVADGIITRIRHVHDTAALLSAA